VSATLTYVYCLVRSGRRPSLRGVPDGMPGGGPVRILDVPASAAGASAARSRSAAPSDWLVVSSVPGRTYNEAALQREMQRLEWIGARAIAHEAVIEHFLKADAVLPMQLFALFTDDERAMAHVQRDRRRISRILSKIAGHVEWGLRLTLDEVEKPTAIGARAARRRPQTASGLEYLAQKRELRDRTRLRLQRAAVDANRVYRAIAREAADAHRRPVTERAAPGSRLVLDAAFLVPAGSATAFRASVRRHAAPLKRSGISPDLTGPWPPYNFI
jgi:hypothetical protein